MPTQTTPKPPAISGVSASAETVVMIKYPSICCRGIGRALGSLYESIPAPKINGIKPSYLLFPLPTAPFAALGYLTLKVSGERYVLTNRSVQICSSLGNRRIASVALSDIDEIEVIQQTGQKFFKAADLYLLNSEGESLATVAAVPHAEGFRQTILKARDALVQVEAALATIEARKSD